MGITFRNINTLFNDLAQTLSQVGSRLTNFRQGSGLYTLSRAWLALLARTEVELRDLVLSFYVQLATGDDLDRRVEDFGLKRKDGSYASGRISIVANLPTVAVLPRYSLVQVPNSNISFLTQTEVTVGGRNAVTVDVISTSPTAISLPAGSRLVIPALPNAVVTTIQAIQGGSPPETDKELRQRFQDFILSLQESTLRGVRRSVLAIPGVTQVMILDQYPIQGVFTVVYDTSTPDPNDLLPSVRGAVETAKGLGVPYQIIPVVRRKVDLLIRVTYVNSSVVKEAELDITRVLSNIKPGIGVPINISTLVSSILRANKGIVDVAVLSPGNNIVPREFERLVINSFKVERLIL